MQTNKLLIISNNLALLRKSKNLTQKEFASIFGYSDKAVSRWELGDSLPAIDMLLKICDYYRIDFSWLLTEHKSFDNSELSSSTQSIRIAIASLCAIFAYTLAVILFVYLQIANNITFWQSFIWAVPIALIPITFCSRKWWDLSITTIFISLFIWSLITSIFLQLLPYTNTWLIFLLGVPLQCIIILFYTINKRKNR